MKKIFTNQLILLVASLFVSVTANAHSTHYGKAAATANPSEPEKCMCQPIRTLHPETILKRLTVEETVAAIPRRIISLPKRPTTLTILMVGTKQQVAAHV